MGRKETTTKNLNAYEVQQLRMTMTMSQLCQYYRITYDTLYRWAKRHNVIMARITDWEVAEGIGKKTVKELAYEYNVTERVIRYRLSKLGMCARQPGQTGGRK